MRGSCTAMPAHPSLHACCLARCPASSTFGQLQALALRACVAHLPPTLPPSLHTQVEVLLEACAAYLQRHALDALPAAVLRVALDLGLHSLAAHLEADFLQVGH